MLVTPTIEQVIKTMTKLGYKVFDNDSKPYNLNIVGLRTADMTPNTFNDWEFVFWKYRGSWEGMKFPITTDPGLYYLKNPPLARQSSSPGSILVSGSAVCTEANTWHFAR
jgi:hypothetical protein